MKFEDVGENKPNVDAKHFVRLKGGESVKGVFRGDPYKLYTHWNGKHTEECRKDYGESCEFCSGGDRPKFRFRINFFVQGADGRFSPKVWEQGKTFYDQMRAMHGVDYDLEKTVVRISRTGDGMDDTVYTIMPLPNGLLSEEQDKALLNVKLLDLKGAPEAKATTSHKSLMDQAKAMASEEDIPF